MPEDLDEPTDEASCVDSCSGHGDCAGGLCSCSLGWTGPECATQMTCKENCNSPSGTCQQGACVCSAGFFGPTCGDMSCPHDCWGHGSCAQGACMCQAGWTGNSCELQEDASACDPGCLNGAHCIAGQCFCGDGFTGSDCSKPIEPIAAAPLPPALIEKDTPSAALAAAVTPAAPAPVAQTTAPAAVETPAPAQAAVDDSVVNTALDAQLSELQGLQAELLKEKKVQDVLVTESAEEKEAKAKKQEPKKAEKKVETPAVAKAPEKPASAVETTAATAAPAAAASTAAPQAASVEHAQSLLTRLLNDVKGQLHLSTATTPAPAKVEAPNAAAAPAAAPKAAEKAKAAAKAEKPAMAKPIAELEEISITDTAARPVWDTGNSSEMPRVGDGDNEDADELPVATAIVATGAKTAVTDAAVKANEIAAAQQAVQGAIEAAQKQIANAPGAPKAALVQNFDDEDDANAGATVRDNALVVENSAASSIALAANATCAGDCSGNGVCNDGICECGDTHTGVSCDMPRCKEDCNHKGLCLMQECICDSAFYGNACQHIRCQNDCLGNGYCFQGECHCKDGFGGDDCGDTQDVGSSVTLTIHKKQPHRAPAAIDLRKETVSLRRSVPDACENNCNNHGKCDDGTCHCFTGYSGAACADVCPNECSHQGDCQEGACLCFAGFLGVDCSVKGCCNGHGTCDNPGECVCDAGWSGDDCSIMLSCPDPLCSGHGACESGKCNCVTGFGGPTCISPAGSCSPPCGPNGFCNAASKTCECSVGFVGPTCLSKTDSCDDNCNFKGLCMNGQCACGPGWQGETCDKPFSAPGADPGAGGAGGAA